MKSLKAILTSQRSYVIVAVIVALIAFLMPEYFDRMLLGGSIYPLGVFQRSFIAIVVGTFALLAGLALHMGLAFIWKDNFGDSRRGRTQRRKARGDGSFEGGHSHSAETTAAGLFVGGEMSASDTGGDAGSDNAAFESYGEAFGGGDAGGGGAGGDFGGDGGGGDGGGGGD